MTDPRLNDQDGLASVPSGTVTFLFTDIEGSTQLLERLREQYATVLADQRDLLRAAFAKWNGHEIDTQGDAFFVAFPRALDAVRCVIDGQRALSAHPWAQGVTVRVRMGLHTGEPIIARTGYVGMDVHRAARIASAGHGGQVLLSQTTRDLIYQDLPEGATLRDLGAHKLKDIRHPQPIHQLDIEGLASEFAPLKTLVTDEEPPTPGEPPFKGLQYFDEADADLFFGREQITTQLVEDVTNSRFLAVIGASGSGKSSIVRAGIVPALKRASRAGTHWHIPVITPTAHPLEALATSLTRSSESVTATATLIDDLARDPRSLHLFTRRSPALQALAPRVAGEQARRLLLIVDQFEELFTLCHDEVERRAFIANLLYAVEVEGGATTALIALRADFYSHLAQYDALRQAVAKHQEYIGPMNRAELRLAIEEPAKRGEWEFAPGLVDLMLHDVGADEDHQPEPGALPLLSHALLETWKRRRGNGMTLKSYSESGEVRGAIARTAERVFYQELTPEQQTIARSVFLRLTELGEGTQDTRRRVAFDELVPPAPFGSTTQVEDVLVKLADARLITTSEGTVEVAHEALIREWPTLREWLNQNRDGLRLHRHLTESAQAWQSLNREPGELYRGARLAQALEWAKTNTIEMNPLEREFLEASKEFAQREEAEREAQRQRELAAAEKLAETEKRRAGEQTRAAGQLRRRALWLAGAFVIAGVLAIVAVIASQQASQHAANAQRQAAILLASQAESELANGYHDRSVLLALEALEKYPYTTQAEHALAQAVSYSRALQQYTAHQSAVTSITWSSDGKQVATSSSSDDNVHIWDPATGKTLRVIDMPKGITGNKMDMALNVQWTPDGKRLLTVTGDRYCLGSQDYDLLLWDADSGKLISSVEIANQAAPESGELRVCFGNYPTGAAADIARQSGRLATLGGDNTAIIWDVAWQKPAMLLGGHTKGVNSVDWSPDESKLATASLDGTARIWNAQTGQVLQILQGHQGRVNLAFWSPDGNQLATAGEDGTVRIWEPSSGKLINSISTNLGTVWSLAWAPNGKRLVTGHSDGSLRIWEVESGKLLETLRGHQGIVSDLKWSPVDDRLASGDGSGFARIWNAAFSTAWRVFPPQAARGGDWSVQGASWSRDSRFLTMAGGDVVGATEPPAFSLWDVQANKLTMENLGNKLNYRGMEAHFSPDNKAILYLGFTLFPDFSGLRTAYVFDASSAEIIRTFTPGGDILVRSSAWSPDGSQVATGLTNNQIIIWDYQTGKQITKLVESNNEAMWINYVNWSPDGTKFAAASDESTARVWDAHTWELLYTLQHQPPTYVDGVGWSPDGTRLLTMAGNDEQGAKDATARVWDGATGKELLVFTGHTKAVFPGDWSPNGKRIATFSNDGTVKVWDAATGAELLTLSVPVLYSGGAWWSPDGQHLAIVGEETLISVWRVWQSTAELVEYAKQNSVIRDLTAAERAQFGLR